MRYTHDSPPQVDEFYALAMARLTVRDLVVEGLRVSLGLSLSALVFILARMAFGIHGVETLTATLVTVGLWAVWYTQQTTSAERAGGR